jgi:hypothetical protein
MCNAPLGIVSARQRAARSDRLECVCSGHERGAIMQADAKYDGQISYDFDEFCDDYGHPAGQSFTFEVTHNAVTYVYADVIGTVLGSQVVFSLNGEDLVLTRKAH